jgi:diguanylate cyclase
MLNSINLSLRLKFANFICPEIFAERRKLERLANVDQLTGLANRRAFDLASERAFAAGENVVVLFDANNFGKINKIKGHETGDHYLKLIAESIRRAADRFNLGERVFRLGGDEFVVICPRPVADLIRDAAEMDFGFHRIYTDDENFIVSVSGTIGDDLDAADQLLQSRKQAAKQGK